jgi:hypothetical protein
VVTSRKTLTIFSDQLIATMPFSLGHQRFFGYYRYLAKIDALPDKIVITAKS